MSKARALGPESNPIDGSGHGTQPVGERHALIIGINDYEDTDIRNLSFAKEDAEAVHQLLVDPRFGAFPERNVKLLVESDASRADIITEISTEMPKRVGSNDQVLIYYAGHGAILTDPRFADGFEKFLVPQDGKADRLPAKAISMADLGRHMERVRSRQFVLFLDACYAGGAAEGRGCADPSQLGRAGKMALQNEHLDRLAGEGRMVLTACDASEVAREDDGLSHGVFTYYMLEGLRGAADPDGRSGKVSLLDLYSFVSERVSRHAKNMTPPGSMEPVLRGKVKGSIVLTHYETAAQKEAKRLANEAAAADERGDEPEALQLWTRIAELAPGDTQATERLAAIANRRERAEKERRTREAELSRQRRTLVRHFKNENLSVEEYNYLIILLEKPDNNLSHTEERERALIARLGEGVSITPLKVAIEESLRGSDEAVEEGLEPAQLPQLARPTQSSASIQPEPKGDEAVEGRLEPDQSPQGAKPTQSSASTQLVLKADEAVEGRTEPAQPRQVANQRVAELETQVKAARRTRARELRASDLHRTRTQARLGAQFRKAFIFGVSVAAFLGPAAIGWALAPDLPFAPLWLVRSVLSLILGGPALFYLSTWVWDYGSRFFNESFSQANRMERDYQDSTHRQSISLWGPWQNMARAVRTDRDWERTIGDFIMTLEERYSRAQRDVATLASLHSDLDREYYEEVGHVRDWAHRVELASNQGRHDLAEQAVERELVHQSREEHLKPHLEVARKKLEVGEARLGELHHILTEIRGGLVRARMLGSGLEGSESKARALGGSIRATELAGRLEEAKYGLLRTSARLIDPSLEEVKRVDSSPPAGGGDESPIGGPDIAVGAPSKS